MKDLPRSFWKALGTLAIWGGVAVCAVCQTPEMRDIVGAGAVTTVLIWIFG